MDCLFCKIIKGDLPSTKVMENDRLLAFHDIQPCAPVHVLIIPKKHFASLNEAADEDWPVIGELHAAAQSIAKQLGVAETGYRLVNNCGANAGQVVHHLHYHLLGGEKLAALNAY